jgi:hypothetical protein
MEVRKELVLNDEEITTIEKFSELVWDIINETGFSSSCVLNHLYECGADSYV